MRYPLFRKTLWPLLLIVLPGRALGEVPVTLATVRDPGPNKLDEPLAERFSAAAAVRFLDSAALTWQKQRKCFTCHTNYAQIYARSLVGPNDPAAREVRQYAEELVNVRWKAQGPRWDAEVVATAAALAFSDANTTGKLAPTTRAALDRMWTVQRPDGGWKWLDCDWPPMESDEHYGACLAALAVAVAPENYRHEAHVQGGLARLRAYLAKNPPPMLHHEAMLLWASSYGESYLAADAPRSAVEKLRKLQRPDGGWSLPDLGAWKRQDGSPQSSESDGYGTGLVVFVLRRSGVDRADPAVRRGVDWLKTHQRASGRWITRSLKKDGNHFLTHAGTAFGLMALASVEDVTTANAGDAR